MKMKKRLWCDLSVTRMRCGWEDVICKKALTRNVSRRRGCERIFSMISENTVRFKCYIFFSFSRPESRKISSVVVFTISVNISCHHHQKIIYSTLFFSFGGIPTVADLGFFEGGAMVILGGGGGGVKLSKTSVKNFFLTEQNWKYFIIYANLNIEVNPTWTRTNRQPPCDGA